MSSLTLFVAYLVLSQEATPSAEVVAEPEQRRATVTWSLWATTSVDDLLGSWTLDSSAPLSDFRNVDLDQRLGERRPFYSSAGLRSFVEATYSPSQELDFSLSLTLSRDVVDVLTGLAGGVRMGGWVVRAESSSFKGQAAARPNLAMPPDIEEVKSRFATVRAGYYAFDRSERRADDPIGGQGVVYGAGISYHRVPVVGSLKISDSEGEALLFEDFDSVAYPEARRLIIGGWWEADGLRAVMADDNSELYTVRVIDNDQLDMSIGFDMSVLFGPMFAWFPDDLDDIVETITGLPYNRPGKAFGLGYEIEFRGGAVVAFDVAGHRTGLQLGFQFLSTGGFAVGSGRGLDGLEPNTASAGASPAPLRMLYGPYLRLAAQL